MTHTNFSCKAGRGGEGVTPKDQPDLLQDIKLLAKEEKL